MLTILAAGGVQLSSKSSRSVSSQSIINGNRGAVLSQMPHEAVVTSTKSVRHYGVSANAIYKEAEDAGQPKIWDKYESLYRVSKMTWYINYVSLFSRSSIPIKIYSVTRRTMTSFVIRELSFHFIGNYPQITSLTT